MEGQDRGELFTMELGATTESAKRTSTTNQDARYLSKGPLLGLQESETNRAKFSHSTSTSSTSSQSNDLSSSSRRVQKNDKVCFFYSKTNQLCIGQVMEIYFEDVTTKGFLGPRKFLVRLDNLKPFESPLTVSEEMGVPEDVVVDENEVTVMEYKDVQGFQVVKGAKRGYIQQLNQSTRMAHIRIVKPGGTPYVIPFVKVADLEPGDAWKIRSGQTVLYEDWIGRVKLINRDIEMIMPDQRITTWEWNETNPRFSKDEDIHWRADLPFFIGQEISVPVVSVAKTVERQIVIEGSKFIPKCATVDQSCIMEPPPSHVIAKVRTISIVAIEMEWIKRIPGSKMDQPVQNTFFKKHAQTIWKKLDVLDHISGDYVKIGSKRMYNVRPTDKMLTKSEALHHLLQTWFPKRFEHKYFIPFLGQEFRGTKVLIEVMMIYSGIEVAWEDGTMSLISAPKLQGCIFPCPVKIADFSVGSIVVHATSKINAYAVVTRLLQNEFMVIVKWFDGTTGKCETVSCLDIKRLDDLQRQSSCMISWRPSGNEHGSKTCIVRRNANVTGFKAAVLLGVPHADSNGMLTAFCGNKILLLSPVEIANCNEIFNLPKKVHHKLVLKLNNSELSASTNTKHKIDPQGFILYRSDELNCKEEVKSNVSVLKHAPKQHYFYGLPYDPKETRFSERMVNFNNLSETIYQNIWVCTYEDRLDLFSVLIVGMSGCPYLGGLFAFEIYLPKEYPEKVPLIVYVGPLSLPNPALSQFDNSKRGTSLISNVKFAGPSTNYVYDPKTSTLTDILNMMAVLVHFEYDGHVSVSPIEKSIHNGLVIVEILNVAYQILQKPHIIAPWGSIIEKQYPFLINTLVKLVRGCIDNRDNSNSSLLPAPVPPAILKSLHSRLKLLTPLLN